MNRTAAQEAMLRLETFAKARHAADPARSFDLHFRDVTRSREPLLRALAQVAEHPAAMTRTVDEFRSWLARNLDRVPPEVRAVWGND